MSLAGLILMTALGLGWTWAVWKFGYEDGRMDESIGRLEETLGEGAETDD